MSNELANWHIEQGSPFGDDLGIYELADQLGCILSLSKIGMTFDSEGDATEISIDEVGFEL